MKVLGREIDFPAKSELNFESLFEYLKAQSERAKGSEKDYLLDLIKRSKVFDVDGGVSKKMLVEHQDLINELIRTIFPPALTLNEIKGVTAPWDLEFIYKSERLQGILDRAGKEYVVTFDGFGDDDLFIAACTYIMGMYYGFPPPAFKPYYFNIPNKQTRRIHSYRLATNVDHIKVKKGKNAKEITQEIYHELIDNFTDVKRWKKYFPNNSWIIYGFSISNLMDLTADQLINNLTQHLLSGNTDNNWSLVKDISDILNCPIHLSFLRLNGKEISQNSGRDITPMILGGKEKALAKGYLSKYMYKVLLEDKDHFAVPNIQAFAEKHQCLAMGALAKTGIKSYYAAPVIFQGVSFGIMEIGSEEKGALNSSRRIQIEQLMPIIGIAGKRFLDEHDNRVEAIIQSEFTTIHPSVKWRFVNEAEKIILAEFMEEEYEIDKIVFKEVLPLFGQLDIRSSSVIRNEGIKKDLQTQLVGASKVIRTANEIQNMPLYEEMIHVIEAYHDQLDYDMVSASEQDILGFLKKEVEPIMDHLASTNKKVARAAKSYNRLLNKELGFVYNERESFDNAVNTVNKVLSRYIDTKQVEAQAMFPHHYERYATDGLEFNMYIGESISPGIGYHPMLVKNLRLWQLIVMIEMERAYNEVKRTLEKPLSVAALVLAHSAPLAIQYRMDEKQFDVEGAYNVRYEIIKKRIDKAHIKGTDIRITEPGKMVVVYATDAEEMEYLRYFHFLQSKGYLDKAEPEIVLLEDLQGVSGLKALRCGIDYGEEKEKSELSMEDIISEIEEKRVV